MTTDLTTRDALDPTADYGQLTDEQLAALARESGHRPARDELLDRTSRQRAYLVRRLSRDAGLAEADRADAQQEAVLWTLEAIRHYNPEPAAPGGCSFQSFLHRVIACRFIDFLRHRHRYHRHFVLVGATLPPEFDGPVLPHRPGATRSTTHSEESEQQRECEERELSDQIRQQLDQMGVRTRRLWELLAQGASVLEIAEALKISYDSAKRSRRKLLVRLRRSLAVGR